MPLFYEVLSPSGLTDTPGFQAAAVAADIRRKGTDRLDLAVAYSEQPCTAAGVFTQHALPAAPVQLCREILKSAQPCHGLVANSGNANACTGDEGRKDAEAMQQATARALRQEGKGFFVASTGRIGQPLPMDVILPGIQQAAQQLGSTHIEGLKAADAILTSDTRPKVVTVKVPVGEQEITLSAMAKGAGMIEPNMATMLAFIATDAKVEQPLLQQMLSRFVVDTFNAISVDGDMSTNDTVLVLANGVSGIEITAESEALAAFETALHHVCQRLARMIVGDGERITKVVELKVTGAASLEDAEKVARAIGNSLLVKSSWYGNDPNWGRILDAAGYAGVPMREEEIELYYRASANTPAVPAFVKARLYPDLKPTWKQIVSLPNFTIELHLGQGEASQRFFAADLTEGYVDYNKSE
ncbi:MAG: bifunctional glutamate N-acetyltransferase/amino-acid acetyltransferase ArgJ [Verrucomicrobiota bacterium JB022]|nr:bifunctional glutamate N-acetyltransferase/amino-acid acetyltransferase ArgJ [Verrucomicrobiota bacterium JB022]